MGIRYEYLIFSFQISPSTSDQSSQQVNENKKYVTKVSVFNLLLLTENKVCEKGFYKCYRGPCINESLICNGKIDCKGAWDDENNCRT